MAATGVGARPFADRQAVMDVSPMLWSCVGWINPKCLNGVNRLQHLFDFWPICEPPKDLAAGTHKGHVRVALARLDGAQDVDAGDDGPIVVRCTADECKEAP